MKNQVIVGIGEALWDVLPEGRKLGGAPANFAYHVSQFGLDSYIVSAVGDDALGKEIISNFKEKKLNHIVDTVPYPTGTVQVELDPQGVPQYEIKENVAWDNIPFTPQLEALAHRTRAVCWGSLAQRSEVSRTTIMRFIDSTSDDCLRVFDINLRQSFYGREVIEESMRRCSVLKINDEELVIVSRLLQLPGIDVREKCRGLMELFGMKMVVLTCGVNGSYVLTAEEESFCPTPRVEVADTVGAGDSFTGSFVAGLLEGKTMRQAHERAVNVSAFVCTQAGAMPVIPSDLK